MMSTTNKIKQRLYQLCLPFTLISCKTSDCRNIDWHSQHLIHDIYFNWSYEQFGYGKPPVKSISIGEYDCGIGGNLSVIIGGIYAIGYDSSFIIVKLHPFIRSEIEESLRGSKNNRGNYSILNLSDTIYLLKKGDSIHSSYRTEGQDSVYEENGKWYRKNFFYKTPDSLFGAVDYKKTLYYIFDIRNYQYDIYGNSERISGFESERQFLEGRKKMDVEKHLDFTIIDKNLEFEK